MASGKNGTKAFSTSIMSDKKNIKRNQGEEPQDLDLEKAHKALAHLIEEAKKEFAEFEDGESDS